MIKIKKFIMKIFTQGILARRKMVLIFILAILLPSLIVGYLSLATFTKRREAVKRALESSLLVYFITIFVLKEFMMLSRKKIEPSLILFLISDSTRRDIVRQNYNESGT